MKKTTLALLGVCCAAAVFAVAPLAVAQETNQGDPGTTVSTALPPAVDSTYRLAEEDILQLDVWNEPQLSKQQLQVTPDGKVNIAYIGDIQAAGLTQAELTQEISRKLEEAGIIANAKIQITIIKMHQPTCRVAGAVGRPGEIVFKDGDTVFDAIASAGSYTSDAWLEKATFTHRGQESITIDLKKMFKGDFSQNYKLEKGDIIFIPQENYENKFYVLGYVMRPGIFPLKDRTTVTAAITLAGGPNERGAIKNTVVVRGDPAKPERVKCDLTKMFEKADLSQDIPLQPGDVVIVPETRRPDWGKISQLLSTVVNISYLRRYGLF